MKTANRRSAGRPKVPEEDHLGRINIRVPAEIMDAIEAERDSRQSGTSTAQVIRDLLVEALKARNRLAEAKPRT